MTNVEPKPPGRVRRRLLGVGVDVADVVRGRREPGLPPRSLRSLVGPGPFRAIGEEWRKRFVDLAGLRPDEAVLDVGCGCGRVALALQDWLTGPYEGFDVIPGAIKWCQREIASRNPNFNFQVADVRNAEYKPRGRITPERYRFPYDDESFDFAFLTSVFTHLRTGAVKNYLAELNRVLRPGGRVLATYFLLNDEARALMSGEFDFRFGDGDERHVDPAVPERAVAYSESAVREWHERAGLPVSAVHYGNWCGREEHVSLQDITVSIRA